MSKLSAYGCNSHVASDQVLDSLAAIGIHWHRIDVDWDLTEPNQGLYEWGELDRVVAAAGQRSLSLLGVIAYTPTWASGNADRATPPRDPERYVDFVREVARRYRGRIAALSIWNEPNLAQFWHGSRDQYLRGIFVPGLRAVREEAPEIVLAGPDLSSSGAPLKDWLPRILEAAEGLFEVITHHQYDGGDTLTGRVAEIDKLRSFLVSHGHVGSPLWITEIGWDRVTPQHQAELLDGVMRAMWDRPWWAKTFWYDSHGPKWGLVETDGHPNAGAPKPAFFAYRDVIAEDIPKGVVS